MIMNRELNQTLIPLSSYFLYIIRLPNTRNRRLNHLHLITLQDLLDLRLVKTVLIVVEICFSGIFKLFIDLWVGIGRYDEELELRVELFELLDFGQEFCLKVELEVFHLDKKVRLTAFVEDNSEYKGE
jgi:hypothetical protein